MSDRSPPPASDKQADTGKDGNKTDEDLMDTSGDEGGEEPNGDDLLSNADVILGSPGSTTPLKDKLLEKLKMKKIFKEKSPKKNSVSSLVDGLNLGSGSGNGNPQITGAPNLSAARIQSAKVPVDTTAGIRGNPENVTGGDNPGSANHKNSVDTGTKVTTAQGGAPPLFRLSSSGGFVGGVAGVGAGIGTSTGAGTGTGNKFPPTYYTVRRSRQKENPFVELPAPDGNRRKAATCSKPLPGFDIGGDDRQYNVVNFHIPSMKRNVSSSVRRGEEGIFCVTCDETHSFNINEPICVFITDQNFPPSLPSADGRCCVVIRLEDCFLSEQPGLLKEFFGTRSRYLPEGSALFYGSLSHLAMRGLETYAEEVVKMHKVFSNMLPGDCSIAHVVHVPLGGIESGNLIRDMYDLDSWLRSGAVSSQLTLPKSRENFWNVVKSENTDDSNPCTAERAFFVPESYKNSHKIRTVSGETGPLPAKIKPISETGEKNIIKTIMAEISDEFAIDVQLLPVLDRCSGDVVFEDPETNGQRLFVIGASHATRLVGGLAESGLPVINLATPGWTLDNNSAAEIGRKLSNQNAGSGDILIIDPLSNSIFCGTDENGDHVDPVKSDGVWHIPGNLSVRAKSYVKAKVAILKKLIDSVPDCKIILISPLPRYVTGRCCPDPDHLVNFADPGYANEISDDMESVDCILEALVQSLSTPTVLLNFISCADEPTCGLPDLKIDGNPLWHNLDPVHGSKGTYDAMAKLIHATVDELGMVSSQAPPKRPRLESIVVRASNSDPNGPSSTKKHCPQSWSAGVLPAKQKNNAADGRQSQRGRFLRGRMRGLFFRRGWGRGPIRGGKKF
jgi:hypothetical protein